MAQLEQTAAPTRWRLRPQDWVVLYRGHSFTLVTFGLFAALGCCTGAWFMTARGLQRGLAVDTLMPELFLACAFAFPIGCRLLSVAHDPLLLKRPLQALVRPGFDFQGGMIAGTLSVIAICTYRGTPVLEVLDCMALSGAMGHAIGRIGCLTYGCCHGAPTDSPFAVTYTHPESKAVWFSGIGGVPVHPTPLYSAAGNLLLVLAMDALFTTPRAGVFVATYLMAAAVGRLAIEFLRGEPALKRLGLTSYQWITLAQFCCGLLLLLVTGPARPLQLGLGEALLLALPRAWQLVVPFVVLFAAYGLHGKRVGTWLHVSGER